MFKSVATTREERPMSPSTDGNINSLTMDVISEIEKELLDTPYDMTSLVFLLYDVPDTALQRLLVYQRVSKDIYSTNINLLHDWMLVAKADPTWRHKFLEALLICQLYSIVRKLGLNIQEMKRQYQPDNIYFEKYINLTKKTLYKLSEKMDSDSLNTLKRSLHSYNIDTSEYESCELVFLKLMSEKVIVLAELRGYEKTSHNKFSFEKLLKLLRKLPSFELFASEFRMLENRGIYQYFGHPAAASSPTSNPDSDVSAAVTTHVAKNHIDQEFASLFDDLDKLQMDDSQIQADSKIPLRGRYEIKDPNKIGLCLIINQEDFHLCDQSIEDRNLKASLPRRKGSSFDKIALQRTMSSLKFEVISKDNLNHCEMIDFIKRSVKMHVKDSLSIFMLCILSHGVKDHVFAADSVKVRIEDVQKLLDSDEAQCLRGIPKVLIFQACQAEDIPQITMVADSPSPEEFYLGKSDFLVYLATSPEYEAFRSEEGGSIFIQCLCKLIIKQVKQEHLQDIFTHNNYVVHSYCNKIKKLQMPLIKTSLRKKLYLYEPKC